MTQVRPIRLTNKINREVLYLFKDRGGWTLMTEKADPVKLADITADPVMLAFGLDDASGLNGPENRMLELIPQFAPDYTVKIVECVTKPFKPTAPTKAPEPVSMDGTGILDKLEVSARPQ